MKNYLLLCMMISLTLNVSAYDIEVKNADGITIYYNYINDLKELEVAKGFYSDNIVIPEEVVYENITRKVTSIGEKAFYNCDRLTSVIIPNSVKSIGDSAFLGCSGLTSVTIGNSVTSIGRLAFEECRRLTSVAIPNSVMSIGERAFNFCDRLTSVTIGNSVTNIGRLAFGNCYDLTTVTIPNSVTSIGNCAFSSCGLTSVTIGNSVTSIGDKAFEGCRKLTSVTIPNSVTSIGEEAFKKCSGLTSVTIGNSVTSIGQAAFQDCTGLTSVHISDIAAWCKISFDYFSSNPLNYAQHLFLNGSEVKDLIIPNSVTSIGERAFYYCIGLTSVKIPNSVTSIGKEAFHGCFKLTTVVSLIEEPFAIEGNWTEFGTFSKNTFNKATLYVPNGTIAKYKATVGWRDFIYILEFDPSGINNVLYNERKDAPAYNLNGRRVNQPQKGIIIIDGKKIISR